MTCYYNEHDPYPARWLRNLIDAGHIANGDVDERSIRDVEPSDLEEYDRCHFFAGIAGWDLALQLAGWPDDLPVWTGSCPCQPFSQAGHRRGTDDPRHVWPEWFRLIQECRPPTIFGEQVASKDGRAWLAAVRSDLENLGYAVGCADLCAASVGAFHVRQRLWFVAHARSNRRMARGWRVASLSTSGGELGTIQSNGFKSCQKKASTLVEKTENEQLYNFWKTEPRNIRVVDGIPNRMGQLRAYGNAIVPQVAAEFIGAFMDTL